MRTIRERMEEILSNIEEAAWPTGRSYEPRGPVQPRKPEWMQHVELAKKLRTKGWRDTAALAAGAAEGAFRRETYKKQKVARTPSVRVSNARQKPTGIG